MVTERDMKITTIYFGGGTPTSIEAEEMDALYETMYASFPNMKMFGKLRLKQVVLTRLLLQKSTC